MKVQVQDLYRGVQVLPQDPDQLSWDHILCDKLRFMTHHINFKSWNHTASPIVNPKIEPLLSWVWAPYILWGFYFSTQLQRRSLHLSPCFILIHFVI
jgi:hypothetical protein